MITSTHHSALRFGKAALLVFAFSTILAASGCISGGGSSSGSSGSQTTTTGEPTDASVTVSWVPPTTRQDGSPISLSELAGYEIRYGTTDGVIDEAMKISDQSQTTARIALERTGTYYFMIRTFDTEGRFSSYSERQEIGI